MYKQPLHIHCSIWLDTSPEKPRWCLGEQVCQGGKVQSALSSPEDWILRYIRTCLLNNRFSSQDVGFI